VVIWDLHCHLVGVPGRTPGERIARLIDVADRMGVERLILSMGMSLVPDPTPQQLRQQNDELLEALSHWHHRAWGLVYLSPKHPEASLQELERCVAQGPMVGVKLWVAVRCSDPRLDLLIRRAAELKALVFQHTWLKSGGNLPGESTPQDLVELARRHPEVPLVCGHSGGNWELGIRAVRDCPNIYLDTAGSDPTSGFVEMAVREVGASRVLYGSDCGGRSFASQIAKVTGAELPPADQRQILGGNLRRLLFPILRAKGVRL
jgi:predicted TIM-barrel fold metal-dependent hydrolase